MDCHRNSVIGRELEFYQTTFTPVEAAQRLIGLSQYLIIKGAVIKDGDSVGVSAEEKIIARYLNQGARPAVPVIRLMEEASLSSQRSPAPAAPTKTFGKRGM